MMTTGFFCFVLVVVVFHFQTDNNATTNSLHNRSFVGDIWYWPMGWPHKGRVMWKAFTYYGMPVKTTLPLITHHYFPVEKAAVGKAIIEGRDSSGMEQLSSLNKMSGSVIKQNVILQYICKYIARKHRENVITYLCSNFDAGLTTFSYVRIRGHRMDIPNESIDIPFRHGGELQVYGLPSRSTYLVGPNIRKASATGSRNHVWR